MPWIQLKLNTTGANAEDLSDALMEAGAVSITFQDTHDTPVFEPLPGETRLWGDTDVIGLFDAETDMNDVVVANILAGPLRELAPLISVLPVSGGLLGLSGILASQAESVCEAYADSFALDPVVEKEEWCRITGRKN